MNNSKIDISANQKSFLTQARDILATCIADIAAIESATGTIGCAFSRAFLDKELRDTLAKIDACFPDKTNAA